MRMKALRAPKRKRQTLPMSMLLLDNQCWLSARVKRDTTTAKTACSAMSSMGASYSYRRLMP